MMNTKELLETFQVIFGDVHPIHYIDKASNSIGGILYECFAFQCKINYDNNTFSISIFNSHQSDAITSFLGKNGTVSLQKDQIIECLTNVNEYCRLRLPENYLRRYDGLLSK